MSGFKSQSVLPTHYNIFTIGNRYGGTSIHIIIYTISDDKIVIYTVISCSTCTVILGKYGNRQGVKHAKKNLRHIELLNWKAFSKLTYSCWVL